MPLPDNPPQAFTEAFYENCEERRLFGDPLLTKEEYWDIWTEMVEHEESRK